MAVPATNGRRPQSRKRIVQPALPLNFAQKKQAHSHSQTPTPPTETQQTQAVTEEHQKGALPGSTTDENEIESPKEQQEPSTDGITTPERQADNTFQGVTSVEETPQEPSFVTAPEGSKEATELSSQPEVHQNGIPEQFTDTHEPEQSNHNISESQVEQSYNAQMAELPVDEPQKQFGQSDVSSTPSETLPTKPDSPIMLNGTPSSGEEFNHRNMIPVGVQEEPEAPHVTQLSSPQVSEESSNGLEVTKNRLTNGAYRFSSGETQDAMTLVPSTGDSLTSPVDVPSAKPFLTLDAHIATLAATKEWADWQIQVYQPENLARPFVAYAHSMVLCRSNPMRRFMERAREQQLITSIALSPPRPVVEHAFEAALRFLYTDHVLTSEALGLSAGMHVTPHARPQLLDYVVSYWISGIELGLRPVALKGEELFGRVLSWEILELAVKDAVSLGLPQRGGPREQEYLFASNKTYEHVFSYIAANLDVRRFELDIVTPATLIPALFSQLDDRPHKHNPALAGMVFGSMPTSPTSPHSPVINAMNSVASIIMLNISFEGLSSLTDRLKRANGIDALPVIHQVLAERERRRLKVVSDRKITNKQRMSNSAIWDVAGYREYIDNENNLKRERIGFLLPSK